MNSSPIDFHKIWIDQCVATEGIRERFGLDNALNYLIGEKLFSFLHAAERDPLFTAEVFVDAYGPEEQASGVVLLSRRKDPVPVPCAMNRFCTNLAAVKRRLCRDQKMAPEDSCSTDMLVTTRWNNRNIAVPLSQVKGYRRG